MVKGGGVNEPAHTVGVVVNFKGAGAGLSGGVKLGDGGFGNLTGGEVSDLEGNFWWRLVIEMRLPEGLGGRIEVVKSLRC